MQPSPNGHIYTVLLHLRLRALSRGGTETIGDRGPGVRYETVPPNIGSYTHEVLQLPKLELNRTTDMPKWMGGEEPTRPRHYTENYRHKACREQGKQSSLEKNAPLGYPIANIHTHNTIKTEQGVLT